MLDTLMRCLVTHELSFGFQHWHRSRMGVRASLQFSSVDDSARQGQEGTYYAGLRHQLGPLS
jgi:hypothetical protein